MIENDGVGVDAFGAGRIRLRRAADRQRKHGSDRNRCENGSADREQAVPLPRQRSSRRVNGHRGSPFGRADWEVFAQPDGQGRCFSSRSRGRDRGFAAGCVSAACGLPRRAPRDDDEGTRIRRVVLSIALLSAALMAIFAVSASASYQKTVAAEDRRRGGRRRTSKINLGCKVLNITDTNVAPI